MSDYLTGKEYDTEEMVHNIREFLSCATDKQLQEGLNWYTVAYSECARLADFCNKPVNTIIGVVAALSPNNDWDQNILDAESLIKEYLADGCPENVKVCTYGANKAKAWEILCTDVVFPTLSGQKVTSFYQNILSGCEDYVDLGAVTVDMWALRAAAGVFDSRKLALSPSVYDRARQAYTIVARDMNRQAKDVQAVAWVVIRDLTSGIRTQLTHSCGTLFCPNCLGQHNYIVKA